MSTARGRERSLSPGPRLSTGPAARRDARRADGRAPWNGARYARDGALGRRRDLSGRPAGGGGRSSRQSRATAAVPTPPWRRRRAAADVAQGLAEFPLYDPQTGVARDPRVTEAAMCVRLVDVRITCGLHDDAQIAAVFIDPRAK